MHSSTPAPACILQKTPRNLVTTSLIQGIPTSQGAKNATRLPSLKLRPARGCPENMPGPKKKENHYPSIHFQVRTVSFREGLFFGPFVPCLPLACLQPFAKGLAMSMSTVFIGKRVLVGNVYPPQNHINGASTKSLSW